ncbi:MAG: hypothetical protein RIA63_00205, partial [Cyclobacteriaceae bacterium]
MRHTHIVLLLIFSFYQLSAQLPALHFVKTVKQKGPVAYRDPFGAISPDGKLFAYSDRNQIFVQQIQGGATFELEKRGAFVITLRWTPNSNHIVTYEIGGEKNYW